MKKKMPDRTVEYVVSHDRPFRVGARYTNADGQKMTAWAGRELIQKQLVKAQKDFEHWSMMLAKYNEAYGDSE